MIDVRNGSSRSQTSDGSLALNRVSQLASLPQKPATVLPVYTRFHQAHQQLTIPVVAVVFNGEILEVKTIDGTQHSINIELFQDIVVFSDGSGKPVFLSEFFNGADIVQEHRRETEERRQLEINYRMKHRFDCGSISSKKSTFKPMIRKQKKKEKVHQYVVTLQYPKRKAA